MNGPHWFPFHGWCRISCLSALLAINSTSVFFLSFNCYFLCDCQSTFRFLHKKTLVSWCCLYVYLVCVKLFIVALIFAHCVFIPSTPRPPPPLSPPVGNSDSGKWDSWFEGETSACGRRAGLRRGSEWDKRMHTGEDESIEFLMCIDGWFKGRRLCWPGRT